MVVCMVGGHIGLQAPSTNVRMERNKERMRRSRAKGIRGEVRGAVEWMLPQTTWCQLVEPLAWQLNCCLCILGADLRGACAHADILSTGARADQSGSSKPFATVEYEDCMIDTFEAGVLLYPHRGNQIEAELDECPPALSAGRCTLESDLLNQKFCCCSFGREAHDGQPHRKGFYLRGGRWNICG
jgi:hypothetical protein